MVITADGKERPIQAEKLEAVIVFSGAHITTPCLTALMQQGVPVTFLSSRGALFGRAESTAHFNIERHRQQFKASEDERFCLEVAKRFVRGKLHNELVVLRRYNRYIQSQAVDQCIREISVCANRIETVQSLNQLNGIEGYGARQYFAALSAMVREEFRFKGRTRQPPRDPFNSLLSFGYTLLIYEIYAVVLSKGLHPYVGFLHRIRQGHPALASDLMEEWRPVLVDTLVMRLVQEQTIVREDFEPPDREGGVYLRKDRARLFIENYQQRLNVEHQYLPAFGPLTFRQAIHHQVEDLVRAIESLNPEVYRPVMLR